MKTYQIPVCWQMIAVVNVEAESLNEAMQIAQESELPAGDYLDDSYEVDAMLAVDMNSDKE